MITETTDPKLKSFIPVNESNHFPIQNLPYGAFIRPSFEQAHIGVAIGEFILDLFVLEQEGLLNEFEFHKVFKKSTLNDFMALGKQQWTHLRKIISQLLRDDNPKLRDDNEMRKRSLVAQKDVTMVLPVQIGDYTDFYSSKHHATNVGIMFRGRENALQPNWLHLPVGYHGRASSVVISKTPVKRPMGQIFRNNDTKPIFTSCKRLDFELEMGFLIGPGNNLGEPIKINDAEKHIFGLVLVNDWSARDIQKWEYVPLGPFNSKNFITSISPWIVTIEALEPFIIPGDLQDPTPLNYLQRTKDFTFNIHLEAYLQTLKMKEKFLLSNSNCKYLYWSMDQQLVHHTITGCNLRTGDLLASGTISGPNPTERGCLLELSWDEEKGSVPINLPSEEQRTFLEDGDELTLTGWAQGKNYKIGFGEVMGKILPANE
jgi:fumarylacetoacetase